MIFTAIMKCLISFITIILLSALLLQIEIKRKQQRIKTDIKSRNFQQNFVCLFYNYNHRIHKIDDNFKIVNN